MQDIILFLHTKVGSILFITITAAVVSLVGGYLVSWLTHHAFKLARHETKLEKKKQAQTLDTIFQAIFHIIVWLWAIFAVLNVLGVNIAALMTGAGLLGVIISLGAQNTIKDVLAGIFILTERQYRVGDIVSLAGGTLSAAGAEGVVGVVEDITLRITRLRTEDGKVITVRNGEPAIIGNQTVRSSTAVVDITVSYDSDQDALVEAMNQVGVALAEDEAWRPLIVSPIHFLRVESFADLGVRVRAIGTVRPGKQWSVAGEYRKRLIHRIQKSQKIKLAHI